MLAIVLLLHFIPVSRCLQLVVVVSRDVAPEVPPALSPPAVPTAVQPSGSWLRNYGDDVFGVVAAAVMVVLADRMVRSGYWTGMHRFSDW